jgi:hypothetical protein
MYCCLQLSSDMLKRFRDCTMCLNTPRFNAVCTAVNVDDYPCITIYCSIHFIPSQVRNTVQTSRTKTLTGTVFILSFFFYSLGLSTTSRVFGEKTATLPNQPNPNPFPSFPQAPEHKNVLSHSIWNPLLLVLQIYPQSLSPFPHPTLSPDCVSFWGQIIPVVCQAKLTSISWTYTPKP